MDKDGRDDIGATLTRTKDHGVPYHNVVMARRPRDTLWRLSSQALKVANETAFSCC